MGIDRNIKIESSYIFNEKYYIRVFVIVDDLSHFLVGHIGEGVLFKGLRKLVNFIKR